MNNPADLHQILARISSYFIGEFIMNDALGESFRELAGLTGADRVYLYRIHHKAKLAHITHEWLNPDLPDVPASTPSFALSDFTWLIDLLAKDEVVQIKDLNDLPSSAAIEKQTLQKQGVSSFLSFPLRMKDRLEGLIGIDFLKEPEPGSFDNTEIIKIATDIIGISIERKLSETSLRKSERLYEGIFENTGAATLTIRPDTGISMVNSEFEHLTGYTRREVEGKVRLIELVSSEYQANLMHYHHLMLSNPDAVPENFEFDYITKLEEIRNAYMTGSALIDTKNCVISFIDITEFKETENQLIIAKDKAEESDRLKSAFLANVSHEIRTPLNAITGFSALLANPNLHFDKKDKYIKQILNGSNELVSLIDNVLDISRIESDTLKPKISEFLLNTKLKETLDFYNDYKLHHAKEELVVKLQTPKNSQKLLIKTDKLRFQQILANLIENAIKFTSSGTIEYGYSIVDNNDDDSDNQSLLFYVKDTGIGISKQDRDKVFHRFVKIIDKDDQLYRGAGLGLALSSDLVNLLGGKIWIESSLGKGSTFYFTHPYEAPSEIKTNAESSGEREAIDWSEKTILVAEDTESNFLYIEEILSETGVKLIRAKDGLDAIEKFRSKKGEIDLVFMDILMPEYDGFEATKEIRKIRKDIPVVAQTAFTFEGELEDGLYSGCFNDYILKPFNIKSIQELMQKYLYSD